MVNSLCIWKLCIRKPYIASYWAQWVLYIIVYFESIVWMCTDEWDGLQQLPVFVEQVAGSHFFVMNWTSTYLSVPSI